MRIGSCGTRLSAIANFHQGDQTVSVDKSDGHPAMDYPQHEGTYSSFLRFTKIAIVLLVLLLAGMKYFLV